MRYCKSRVSLHSLKELIFGVTQWEHTIGAHRNTADGAECLITHQNHITEMVFVALDASRPIIELTKTTLPKQLLQHDSDILIE